MKEIDMQVQEVQRIPIMIDAKRPTLRHTNIKRSNVKDKERLLEARKVSYQKFSRWEGGGGEWVKK